jgi:hypothetical protein
VAKRTRIIVPLLALIVGLVLVVGLLASRSQETRVLDGGEEPRTAQAKEAGDIDVRVTDQGLEPRSAVVRQGQIVQWRNETRRAVRFVPAQPDDERSQGLTSSPVPAGGTFAFRPVEPGRIAYRAAVEPDAAEAGPRGVLEVR